MPTQVQFRRGNTAQHSTFTGAIGELTVNTEKNTVVVHDGSTTGGFTLALESSQQDALAYNQANAAFETANTKVSKSGDIMTGSLTTSSNVRANVIIANTEFFAGIATEQAVILPDRIAQFTSNSETYVQVNQQNINGNGSADFVITADVGSDTTFYTDMGMAGSTYNFYDGFDTPFEPLTGYFLVQGNTGQDGGNMVIGTTSPSTNVQFLVGGFENSNVVLKLEETGAVVKGNVTPLTNNVYFLGSESKRWHSLYVGPGSIDIDGIVLSNNNGQLTLTGATDFVVGSSPSTQGISDKANAAFLAANTAITYTDNAIANLINSAPASLDTLNELAAALGDDENFSTTILNTISISGSYANSAFGAANTADQRAVTSGLYANASYTQANTASIDALSSGSYANSAFGAANTADQRAVTSGVYANSAFALSNSTLQYAQSGYAQANTGTILAQSSYDFANTLSSGSAQDSTARQFADSAGSYANSAFGAANTADQKAVTSGSYANSAYLQANTGTILAQAAFDSANNVAPQIQPSFDQANTANQSATSAGSYANSAFAAANTADQRAVTSGVYANSAYLQSNTATTNAATADQRAVTSGVYANSAFDSANTANQSASSAGSYANSAFTSANTADQKAVTSGVYANSAYDQANTATTNSATADQRAVTSGSYANSSFAAANTADQRAVTSGSYANSSFAAANTANTNAATADQRAVTSGVYANGAFATANTADQRAVTSGVYANAAFGAANTADQKAVTSGVYANAAFAGANTATTNAATADQKAVSAGSYANSAYAHANTKFSSSGGTISGDLTVSGNLSVLGNVTSYSSQDLIIDDPIILLANNNNGNAIDLGFTAHYIEGGTLKHTGLLKDVSANTWYLFDNYGPHVQDNNLIDPNDSTFRFANLTANIVTSVAFIRGYDPINHANASYAQANTAATNALSAGSYANSAYLQSNTATTNAATADQRAVTSGSYANSAYTQANTGTTLAQAAFNTANTKYDSTGGLINGSVYVFNDFYAYNTGTGFDTSITSTGLSTSAITLGGVNVLPALNSASSYANSAYNQANTANTNAATASQRAVTSGVYANSAYNQANTATTNAATADQKAVTSGSYANSAFVRANTSLINNGSTSTTGILFASGLVSNTSVTMNTNAEMTSTAFTTASLSQVTIDSWATATYRSAKYYCQMTSGSSHHVIELSMIHDGTTVYLTQYGELLTGSSLGTFDATISTGTLSVLFTPTNASTSIKLHRLLIDV
jgi:hypothetical protein